MYTTTWCGYCNSLKRQLKANGIEWDEVDVEVDADAAALVEKINGGNRVVPTVAYSDGTSMTNPTWKEVAEKLDQLG